MSASGSAVDLDRTLRDRFGLETFRPGQREVIANVLDRRDVLCVMPTGGGKSLCYQLPALLLGRPTLVVSPLIALMKDQVDALHQRGIRATLLNSTLDPAEQRARLIEIEAGHFDLIYVAPERFRSGRFVEALARLQPALLAVDEAHCISEWGHDFRPDYARLGQARRGMGMPPCIALTATATDLVRRDIADQLDLREPAQFVTGFDRPNLHYGVVEARKDAEKLAAVARTLDRSPGSAIIYASSRKRCEEVGRFLEKELRRPTVVYHAGLTREERTLAQDRFMSGDADVVVATNAFGMGVDKADIRSVIHFNMPGTLEAYYQEAGRAGRDGRAAHCVLLYAPGDRFLQELFIENEYPPPEAVFRVYEFLRGLDADPIELTQAEIRESARIDLPEGAVGTALKILEGAGGIERFRPRENMAIIRINAEGDEPSLVDRLGPQANVQRLVLLGLEGLVNNRFGEPIYFHPDDFANALGLDRPALGRALRNLVADLPIDYVPPFRGNAVRVIDRARRARDLTIDFSALDQRKRQEYDKLERMIKYAQTSRCRRAYILGYFGDAEAAHCGHCDNCGPTSTRPGAPAPRAVESPAGREVILKVLSGVARTKGKFGKTTVAQMLTGSGSEKMTRWGLSRLSTFGILADFKQAEVAQILDALTSAGLIECEEVDRFRPIVTLTEAGWAWLRDEDREDVPLSLPDDLALKVRNGGLARRAATIAPDPPDPEPATSASTLDADPLWLRLKTLRSQWARESSQPAYCIFPDRTLEALVRERPRTPHALVNVQGLGPARLERYGAALLEAILREPLPLPPAIEPEPPRIPPIAETSPPSESYISTEEWTWRLLDRGFTLQEAAAIRGLEHAAILRHAVAAARQGKAVPIERFLPADLLARWDDWLRERGETTPPTDPAGLWPLFLACRNVPGAGQAR